MDLLREAHRCLPELADDLATCSNVPAAILADAVAYETYAWVRDADEADRDIVFRILDFWSDVLDRDDADREVTHAFIAALSMLSVCDQPYGGAVARWASPQMRRLMAAALRVNGKAV